MQILSRRTRLFRGAVAAATWSRRLRRDELPCSSLNHGFETRSFPISLVACPRDFAFYVVDPVISIHRRHYSKTGGRRPPLERKRLVFIRVHSWLPSLRSFLERWKRLVDDNPRQFIFEKDHFRRRKRRRIIERRDCHVDHLGIFAVLEKQMRAAACGKTANPIRMRNLARFTFCHDQIFAG